MLPNARQVADPYHVIALANRVVDDCRRRVQNETLGHRGRKHDPLYRVRRRLLTGQERLGDDGHQRLLDLLADGDPNLEVFAGWAAKELVRRIYQRPDATAAADWIDQIPSDFAQRWMPHEVRRLGRTLRGWSAQIVAWHNARVSNGPTEAINNLIKRVKRVRVRVPSLRPLPHPRPALRRQTQLGATRHPHSTVRSEEPPKRSFATAGPRGCASSDSMICATSWLPRCSTPASRSQLSPAGSITSDRRPRSTATPRPSPARTATPPTRSRPSSPAEMHRTGRDLHHRLKATAIADALIIASRRNDRLRTRQSGGS